MSKTPSITAKKKERPAKVLKDLVEELNNRQVNAAKRSPIKVKAKSKTNKKDTQSRYERGTDQHKVPTLDYKGRINEDMYMFYPGLYKKIMDRIIGFPYE